MDGQYFSPPNQYYIPPETNQLLRNVQKAEAYPTLIIGLGRTGAKALSLIRKAITSSRSGSLPKQIRLLWIGTQSVTDLPSNDDRIVVTPNYDDIERNFNRQVSQKEQFSWWQRGQNLSHGGRLNARMAFYWEESFLDRHFEKTFIRLCGELPQPPGNKFQVFWVASLAEVDVALLLDLANLLKRLQGERINASIPWLTMESLESEVETKNPRNLNEMRIAALREIHRSVCGREQLFQKSDGEMCESKPFLFNAVFLMDDQYALESLADQFSLLVENSITPDFHKSLNNIQQSGPGLLISTSGSFTCSWPLETIRMACRLRVVQNMLFASDEVDPKKINWKEEAQYFFRDSSECLSDYQKPFQVLIDSSAGLHLTPRSFPGNIVAGFEWRLQLYLNRVAPERWYRLGMRGQKNYLRWCKSFLDGLANLLRDSMHSFRLKSRSGTSLSTDVIRILQREVPNFEKSVQKYKSQLEHWIQILTDLEKEYHQRYYDLLFERRKVIKGNPYHRALSMDGSLSYPPEQDEKSLSNSVSSFMELPLNTERQTQLEQRLGWVWNRNDQGAIDLFCYILPRDLLSQEWRQALCSLRDRDRIPGLLDDISSYYSEYYGTDNNILEKIQSQVLQSLLQDKFDAQSTLNTQQMLTTTRRSLRILAASDENELNRAKRQILLRPEEKVLRISDPTKIAFLNIEHNLPLDMSVKWDTASQDYYPNPDFHIYPQEQHAAWFESQLKSPPNWQFGPRFVGLMFNKKAFEVAMDCIYCGWIRESMGEDGHDWYIVPPKGVHSSIPLFQFNQYHPSDLESALYSFLVYIPTRNQIGGHDLSSYNGAFSVTINCLQRGLIDPKCHMKLDEDIGDWRKSGNKFLEDLAVFQQHLIQKRNSRY